MAWRSSPSRIRTSGHPRCNDREERVRLANDNPSSETMRPSRAGCPIQRAARTIDTMGGQVPAWALPDTTKPWRSYNGTAAGFGVSR